MLDDEEKYGMAYHIEKYIVAKYLVLTFLVSCVRGKQTGKKYTTLGTQTDACPIINACHSFEPSVNDIIPH